MNKKSNIFYNVNYIDLFILHFIYISNVKIY